MWTVEAGFAQAFAACWGFTATLSAFIGNQSGNDGAYALRYARGDGE